MLFLLHREHPKPESLKYLYLLSKIKIHISIFSFYLPVLHSNSEIYKK